jgi:hypothetical protein
MRLHFSREKTALASISESKDGDPGMAVANPSRDEAAGKKQMTPVNSTSGVMIV